jgi:hypothetical protein
VRGGIVVERQQLVGVLGDLGGGLGELGPVGGVEGFHRVQGVPAVLALVVVPGGVIVVETPSRASAGAYTPRSLAEEVIRYALEPLVFDSGPYQRVDGWEPVPSDRILELKVADIACDSGAFLVAAARYLADRLVEAWHREEVAHGSPHDLHVRAIRTVVATCLYGAAINAMAVEMCKLSLWLVSLDPKLPFSFVDDKVLHGNSLPGPDRRAAAQAQTHRPGRGERPAEPVRTGRGW